MVNIDPKLIIAAAFGVPILYIWMGMNFNVLFLVGLAIWAWFKFDNEFIHKSEERTRATPIVGPQQPFIPPTKEWEVDPNTGEPVARFQVPQYPPRYRQP